MMGDATEVCSPPDMADATLEDYFDAARSNYATYGSDPCFGGLGGEIIPRLSNAKSSNPYIEKDLIYFLFRLILLHN